MRKRIIILGAVMFGLVLVAVCAIIYFNFTAPKPAVVELGPKIPLPDNPIVFRVEDESPTDTTTTLGFIDPDGSHFTTRKIDISLTRDPYHYRVLDQTTWGPDGTFLITQLNSNTLAMNPGDGIPVVITGNGETRFCKRFVLNGSVWGIDSTHVLTNITVHFLGGSDQYQIVKLNTETCRIENVIYSSSNFIDDFAISSDGWIAYATTSLTSDRSIVVLDNQEKEVFIITGAVFSPNWSRDGEWLAYDAYKDVIKIVRRNGRDTQVLTDVGSNPWWSPDGEWLLYWTDKKEIYKINISTKEKVLLYSGGSYPTWR